jgi:hypothetical protein
MVYAVFGLYILLCIGSGVGDRDTTEYAFYLRTEAESSPQNIVLNKHRTSDNVEKVSHFVNVQLSRTFIFPLVYMNLLVAAVSCVDVYRKSRCTGKRSCSKFCLTVVHISAH